MGSQDAADIVSTAPKTLPEALSTARRSVVRLDGDVERAGFRAKEETLTELLLARMAQHATVEVFSRREESHDTGADWIWWFHQGDDWFGLLAQAKRLKKPVNGVSRYDFDYRPRGGRPSQRATLLSAARWLGVPAAYVLYNGKGLPRGTTGSCGWDSSRETLHERMGVAAISALLVDYLFSRHMDVVCRSMPLECLVCARELFRPAPWPLPPDRPDLIEFLRGSRRTLPRRVAGSLLDGLLTVRVGQARAVPQPPGPGREATDDDWPYDTVFENVWPDQGHFTEPYLRHVLRGLRTQPPEYLAAILQGGPSDDLWSTLPDNVGGVVVAGSNDEEDETPGPDQVPQQPAVLQHIEEASDD